MDHQRRAHCANNMDKPLYSDGHDSSPHTGHRVVLTMFCPLPTAHC
jgi:hypothetical protein